MKKTQNYKKNLKKNNIQKYLLDGKKLQKKEEKKTRKKKKII